MLTDWMHRLRSLFRRSAVEQELDDELRFHFEQQVALHMRQGFDREEAVRRARHVVGGLDQIREEHRDARAVRLIEEFVRDVGYAGRQLRRAPGFTVGAVLCLGLGIGVNTTIFGMLNAVLLRPMPVSDPDGLMTINRGESGTFSYADYQDFHARSRVFSGLAATLPMESDVEIGVNVGNLLLIRGAVRGREFAMRRALGATRRRLVQQLLTESFVLALAGGICGVVLARWTIRLLERSIPPISGFAVQMNLSLDWRVLAFAMVITLVTSLVCGLLPAWRASEARSSVPFKGEVCAGRPRRRPFGVIAQVVMSLALLLVAGTFLQAVLRMQTSDPGFAVDDLLYAHTFIATPPPTLEAGRQFYARAIDRLQTLPGVESAALSRFLPLMPAPSDCAAASHDGQTIRISTEVVDTGYFATMDIDVLSGRDFAQHDSVETSPVIVNESLAAQLWPTRPAVGELIVIGCRESRRAVVVGVVRNSAVRSVGESTQPHVFLPRSHSTTRVGSRRS